MAPAYDLTYSDTYWGEHTTSVNGKGREEDIDAEDLIEVGSAAGLKRDFCEKSIREIRDKTESLKKYFDLKRKKSKKLPLQKRVAELKRPKP